MSIGRINQLTNQIYRLNQNTQRQFSAGFGGVSGPNALTSDSSFTTVSPIPLQVNTIPTQANYDTAYGVDFRTNRVVSSLSPEQNYFDRPLGINLNGASGIQVIGVPDANGNVPSIPAAFQNNWLASVQAQINDLFAQDQFRITFRGGLSELVTKNADGTFSTQLGASTQSSFGVPTGQNINTANVLPYPFRFQTSASSNVGTRLDVISGSSNTKLGVDTTNPLNQINTSVVNGIQTKNPLPRLDISQLDPNKLQQRLLQLQPPREAKSLSGAYAEISPEQAALVAINRGVVITPVNASAQAAVSQQAAQQGIFNLSQRAIPIGDGRVPFADVQTKVPKTSAETGTGMMSDGKPQATINASVTDKKGRSATRFSARFGGSFTGGGENPFTSAGGNLPFSSSTQTGTGFSSGQFSNRQFGQGNPQQGQQNGQPGSPRKRLSFSA